MHSLINSHSLIKFGYTTFLSHCKDERAKLYLFSNSPVIVVKVYLKRQIAYKIQIAVKMKIILKQQQQYGVDN